MPETNAVTQAILKMADNTAPFITAGFIDETDVYPYAVPASTHVTSLSILNQHATVEMSMTVTLEDNSTFVFPVPANGAYNGLYDQNIIEIDCNGTDFTIELLRRNL